jgi:TolB-like protein/tetratricopeptide (TPR) repeat protein
MRYKFGAYTLDTDRCELRLASDRVELEPQVFSILGYLLQERSRIVTRGDLITAVWNGRIVSDSTINSRIAAARKVIGDRGTSQSVIKSFPRRGYRFVGDVQTEAQPNDQNCVISSPPFSLRSSIVVLPFANLSREEQPDHFAEGLVDDITTALTQFRHLIVVPRSVGASYRGQTADVTQITKELNVRYTLEGTLRKEGTRIRINAQLVDFRTGANLWARRLEGDLTEGFKLQDRLTEGIVGEVVTKLEQAEIDFHRRASPSALDAYSRVMRGTSSLYEWTPAAIDAALEQYRLALTIEPEFAPAYAMASYCYVQRRSLGLIVDRSGEVAEAVALAWRAAELGKNDAYALSRAAHAISVLGQDISSGMSLVEQAIVLNPNLPAAWYVRGWIRVFRGDAVGALSDLDHARRLSPYDRLVFKINAAMAYAYFLARQYDHASRFALSAIRERPNYMTGLRVAAASDAVAGRRSAARQLVTRMTELDPQLRISSLPLILPLRLPDLASWADALRDAGLPD